MVYGTCFRDECQGDGRVFLGECRVVSCLHCQILIHSLIESTMYYSRSGYRYIVYRADSHLDKHSRQCQPLLLIENGLRMSTWGERERCVRNGQYDGLRTYQVAS